VKPPSPEEPVRAGGPLSDGRTSGPRAGDQASAASRLHAPGPGDRPAGAPLLAVEDLTTAFPVDGRLVPAVNEVSFEIRRGETLGLVGESGSGKSLTAFSILRLVPPPGRITRGRLWFEGRDLSSLPEKEMRQVRGARIALVFQEPMTALNPVLTVGYQIAEVMVVHGQAGWREAHARAVELLDAVSVPDPHLRAREYPHQLSGGQRQRVLMAMALACRPALLMADEPTTALDVTIQAQVLDLLRSLKHAFDLSLLLITHDLGVIAHTADRVAVMYAGRIVEQGAVRDVFHSPKHPYTRGLLASMPGGTAGSRLRAIEGTVPALGAIGGGCAFAPRCAERFDPCDRAVPPAVSPAPGRDVRCFLHGGAPPAPSPLVASDGRLP
jgi:oligopeptide/dipeptide ABC transporter ATP-binding protein